MGSEYTAIIRQSGDWWIGWIEEIPGVNCQEQTHEELIESLRLNLKEALEFNRTDAIAAVGAGFTEINDRIIKKICKDLGIRQVK